MHRTPVVTSRALDERAGAHLHLKAEHLQRTGSFKIRGATNAVLALTDAEAERGVACHSSGNHGQALALAARERGIPATVVVPASANPRKRAAIEGYGARIVDCEPTERSRRETLAAVVAETGAHEVHPFDDDLVIAGQGTAALELLGEVPDLDVLVAPVGGGGLLSGTTLAAQLAGRPGLRVVGAEPAAADDAARSLRTGRLQPAGPPATIADGLLTGLSERTFTIIRDGVSEIVTVDEAEIVAALRFLLERTKLVVEPSGAVAVAAVLGGSIPGLKIGVIVSGGNLDLDRLPW